MHTKYGLYSVAIAIFLVIGVFLVGIYVGYENRPEVEKVFTLINKEGGLLENPADSEKTDFAPFWKVWNIINEKHVGENGASTTPPVTDQDKVWGAIEGLVNSLGDPYSVFLPPEDAQLFEENISGNFGGIGIEIGMRDDALTVISPLKNTPAYRAGLIAEDKIISIDGTPTAGMNIDSAVKLIRGKVGTPVTLGISRKSKEKPFDVEIVRDIIEIPIIETETRNDGIFVIKFYSFSGTSSHLFREALREFVLSGQTKLILDMRGNPGGFLQAAVEIASWFLPAGKVIVTEDYEGNRENVVHRSLGYDIFNENLQMVILVDGGTASASEIVAGALSEYGIATLVGAKTFGKGSVQELEKITADASLKITVAHWKTPKGVSISKDGIIPDHMVEMTQEDKDAVRDPQLEKAIEIISR